MLEIQCKDSVLPVEIFDQLLIDGRNTLHFAESVELIAQHKFEVKWNTHWKSDVPEELRRTYKPNVLPNDSLLHHRTSFSNRGRSHYHTHSGEVGVSCEQPPRATVLFNQPHDHDFVLPESTNHKLCAEVFTSLANKVSK